MIRDRGLGPLAVAVAVAAALQAACLMEVRKNPREELMEAVRDFNDGVHWGAVDVAGKHISPDKRAAWIDGAEKLAREVSFSFYEVRRVELTDKNRAAAVRVELGWYHRAALVERRTTLLERWVRSKGTWILSAVELLDGPPVGG